MLVGERLKEVRKSLKLNKTQMVSGTISRSFYSRVEKNENMINARDLMEIMYSHEVPMVKFCQGLGNTRPQIYAYHERILYAYLKKDVDALNDIYHKGNFADLRIKSFIILLISKLEGQTEEAKKIIQQDLSYNCLQENNWNEENLWFTFFILDLYDFNQVRNLIDMFFNKYHAKNVDEYTMRLVSRILVKYLDLCFKQGKRNNEMNQAIKFLKLLPNKVEFGIYKILATYYEELLDDNFENAQLIADLLQDKDLDYENVSDK